ncbi:helix-turn-helix domain-containing protein [Streptomyces albus]|uniref:helix-turn-helix domain-containing protein n=1 Tax=Streptomyces albus TaxID=1888 RepID=UPI0004C918C0|nr:helix-turn-helix transcriptional regulator [Streptomyces albus]
MEHSEGENPVTVVARRVKELRGRNGFTAQQLAERLKKDQGLSWDRGTVTKLETGRRQSISAVELLALARALNVAPVHLLVPLDDRPYEVTPHETYPAGRVRDWLRGTAPLPGVDTRIFRSEAPEDEWRDPDLPDQAQAENEVSRHLLAGMSAARRAGLTEEQVVEWIRGAWRLADKLEKGPDGEHR